MKIKSLSMVLILVSGTLFGMGPFVQESLGQVAVDDNNNIPRSEERLDILLNILENASAHVQQRLADLQGKGVVIPEKALERAGNGLLKAQAAILKNSVGDVEGATQDALEAMEDFKESLEDVEKFVAETDINDAENEAEDALGLASKIQRTKDLRNKLEDLAEKQEERGHNVSGLRKAIDNADERIAKGEHLIEEGKLKEAKNELGNVTNELEGHHKDELDQIAKSEKPDKTEKFLEKTTERIEKLVTQFEGLPIPEDARQKILESLYNSLTRIKEARGLNDAGDFDDSIESIEDGIDDEKEALGEADRRVPEVGKPLRAIAELEKVIDKFEGKLARIIDNLEKNNVIADTSAIQTKIKDARSILENASQSLRNDIGEAEKLKDLAENLKDGIQDDLENLEDLIEDQTDNDDRNDAAERDDAKRNESAEKRKDTNERE